jgi:hypothetical protein
MVCETTAAGLGIRGVVIPCAHEVIDVNVINNTVANLIGDRLCIICVLV